jgi:hypothetical protein
LIAKASSGLLRFAPAKPRFESEHDSRFFFVYVQQIASEITGPFMSHLWHRLIPQACEAEPYIRRLVTGIGAMSEVCSIPSDSIAMSSRRSSIYEYALRQYDKALLGMQKAIKQGRHDVRSALMACLLVFCFESMLGNEESAAQNARSGMRLLQEHLVSRSSSHGLDIADAKTSDAMDRRVVSYTGLESDLLQSFSRLEAHALYLEHTRSHAGRHLRGDDRVLYSSKYPVPERFETLQESQESWMWVLVRGYELPQIVKNYLSGRPGAIDRKGPCDRYQNEVTQWIKASRDLFAKTAREGTMEERALANLLDVHAQWILLQAAEATIICEMYPDAFLNAWEGIIELGEEAYPYYTSERGFRVNMGTIHVSEPLFCCTRT